MEYGQFSNAVNENLPSKEILGTGGPAVGWVFQQDATLEGSPFMDDPSIPVTTAMVPVDFKKGQVVYGRQEAPNCPPNARCIAPNLYVEVRNDQGNGGVRVVVPMNLLSRQSHLGGGKPKPQDSPMINEGASSLFEKIKRNLPVISIGIAAGVVIGLIIFKKR